MPIPLFSKLCSCATPAKTHALIGITSRTYIRARPMSKFSFSVRHLLQFRFWPHFRHCHVSVPHFTNIGSLAAEIWRLIDFQDDGPCCSILVLAFYLLMSLTSEGYWYLSANQISSTYLNSWPRYNYFHFGKTNVRHIGIILPVSISVILWRSATRRWILLTYARQFLLWAYFTYLLWLWILCVGLF